LQEAIGGKYDAETRFDFVVIAFFLWLQPRSGLYWLVSTIIPMILARCDIVWLTEEVDFRNVWVNVTGFKEDKIFLMTTVRNFG
jgi:hypothetical protein